MHRQAHVHSCVHIAPSCKCVTECIQVFCDLELDFLCAVETLHISKALQAEPYFRRAAAKADVDEATTSIRLLESHGDQVMLFIRP